MNGEEGLRFGLVSVNSGVFVFQVLGPVGTPYTLEFSANLENWMPLGNPDVIATAREFDNPPAGFVFISEEDERFFVRIVPFKD